MGKEGEKVVATDSLPLLLAAYRELLAAADAWFAGCQAEQEEKIRCGSGCHGCCRGLFDITLLDALVLQEAFQPLPDDKREKALALARAQVGRLRSTWPDFVPPFLINNRPQGEWGFPEEDATPCCLLDGNGRCLVYAGRPLTCRLHGLPHIDRSGEIFDDEWCTLNFPDADPLALAELRGDFRALFNAEARLLRRLAAFLRRPGGELDTFIPAALLIDFGEF